jgi:hypothetical protein
MVTFWPADVVKVKPDFDTLSTAPAAPPAAGAERALDAPPPDPPVPVEPLAETRVEAVAEGDAARPTESPLAAQISAAAEMKRPLRFDRPRRIDGPRPGRVSGELVVS